MEQIPQPKLPNDDSEKRLLNPHGLEKHFETNKSPEIFRATLGFDFVFVIDETGKKKCYCVEINGHRTGIVGAEDIPEGDIDPLVRLTSGIRATMNPELLRKSRIAKEVLDGMNATTLGELTIRTFMQKSMSKGPLFPHAIENPPILEEVTNDKLQQGFYIPQEHRPKEYVAGDSPDSSTGYWICKHKAGQNGKHIGILSSAEFKKFFLSDPTLKEHYVVQEFLIAQGADNAPRELSSNPASMRLLIDFRYLENGTIEPLFLAGYQRVSQTSFHEPLDTLAPDDRNKVGVVNKSTGALSFAASEEEMRLGKEVAEKIIRKLATELVLPDITVPEAEVI